MAVKRFHGTSATLADSIRREGLKPRRGLVFLTPHRAIAEEFAAMAAADAGLDPCGLLVTVELDEQLIERDDGYETVHRRPIPPEAILAMEFVVPIARERILTADVGEKHVAVLTFVAEVDIFGRQGEWKPERFCDDSYFEDAARLGKRIVRLVGVPGSWR